MDWLIYALSAAFLWAIVNIVDKIVIEHHVPNPILYVVIDGAIGVVPIVGLMLTRDLSLITPTVMIAGLLTGVFASGFGYLYYRALQIGDASSVATSVQAIPVFSVILGFLFFNEVFTPLRYTGIALIIGATLLASLEHDGQGKHINPDAHKVTRNSVRLVLYLLLAAFLMSVSYALQKFGLTLTDVPSMYLWGRIGSLILSITLLVSPSLRQDVRSLIQSVGEGRNRVSLALILTQELLNLVGVYLILLAYNTGPISLVTTVASIQPLFVIILVLLINFLFSSPIPDKYTRAAYALRLSAVGIMILGINLVVQG